jgi:predicted amidohydrolase
MYVQELQVAAQQHQVFVVAANKAGAESLPREASDITFYGKSCILGPDGTVLAALEQEQAAILSATINLADVQAARTKLNYYRDRREDLYLL